MAAIDVILTAEEAALALTIVGYPEKARTLMANLFGEIEEMEMRGRMLAAGHSLMARGFLVLNTQMQPLLDENLARIAHTLARADFSIRYSYSLAQAEFALVYHFRGSQIFAHRLEQGVLHRITEITDRNDIIKSGLTFFGIPQAEPFSAAPLEMPYPVLERLKDETDPATIEEGLRQAGADGEAVRWLAADLAQPRYRGAAIRVDYSPEGAPLSDRGFLFLHGPRRLWLMHLLTGEDPVRVRIVPATVQAFQEAIVALW